MNGPEAPDLDGLRSELEHPRRPLAQPDRTASDPFEVDQWAASYVIRYRNGTYEATRKQGSGYTL